MTSQLSEVAEKLVTTETIYIDELTGSDEGVGNETFPLKTVLKALEKYGENIKIVIKKDAEDYKDISGAALKKAKKILLEQQRKLKKQEEQKDKQDADMKKKMEEEAKALERAKSIVLTQDPSLSKAEKIKIRQSIDSRGKRVKVSGWVHRLRVQGKDMMFVILRDGSGYLQCVLTGKRCHTYDAITLTTESTITVYGVINALPEGKKAPDNHELMVDYWELVGKAPDGEEAFNSKVTPDADPSYLLDNRHLVLRSETSSAIFKARAEVIKARAEVIKARAEVIKAFRAHYESRGYTEVTPPCMVQTQVEDGSTLFEFNYYGENASESYRAEKSHTRRHLSEFSHLEAEMAFLTFDDLLDNIEDLMCDVIDRVMTHEPTRQLIEQLNPGFESPTRPFLRMNYADAIKYLKDNDIKKEDGSYYQYGEDIPESPERLMTDKINRPILLCRFPADIKSFYMQKCSDDRSVTESVDVLIPNVGEVIGGSMRMNDMKELLEAYKKEGIDPSPYYWYTDQRKYGTSPHGGYGLGVERFLAWLLNRYTVRDCSLYPRFTGRCTP
ncbi:hypothetical protein BC941DRAFT_463312 [Chlamydoabsidia padenii]|nr:hypothetical protein BC941DRAFT_463312 [Chlamydoabsidia padenii]